MAEGSVSPSGMPLGAKSRSGQEASSPSKDEGAVASLSVRDRVRGCLLGGACGDALGAPVEFMTLDQIKSKYGSGGIRDFDEAYGCVGAITDDTQMTLFTVEGIIRAWVRGALKGICHPPSVIHHAYLRWSATQASDTHADAHGVEMNGWLIEERRLWARRAAGKTCLSALASNRQFGTPTRNDSKGCGAVMRTAPIGFTNIFAKSLEETFTLASDSARVSHGHPSGYLSAGALATIIALIAEGQPLSDAVTTSLEITAARDGSGEVCSAIRAAVDLSSTSGWRDRLPELGGGWVGEEALAISVLCSLAAPTPEEAIVAAVNHAGNSNSTGAITGNIVGAMHGPKRAAKPLA